MTKTERDALIDQLDRSFHMMPTWAKTACKHAMGAAGYDPETGTPLMRFRDALQAASDRSLLTLRDDFEDNGDLLPAVATQ